MADRGAKLKGLNFNKSIVLIGLMGAGKSRIGKDLATKYGFSFADTDLEIVKAAGCSISRLFLSFMKEETFRDLEELGHITSSSKKVKVIATGGGAFMNAKNRDNINKFGVSIWLKAELNVLIERTSRRKGRPLLERGDPATILKGLMSERYPIYGKADITLDTQNTSIEDNVNAIAEALAIYFDNQTEIKKNE